jgi:hypothetical protein
MSTDQLWDLSLKSLTVLLVATGAIAGWIKYRQQREKDRDQASSDTTLHREQLNWRRAQFLVDLANSFDHDEDVRCVLDHLTTKDGHVAEGDLAIALRGDRISELTNDQKKLRYAVDRYLEFFDRLASFTLDLDCLKLADLVVFSWYLGAIGDSEALSAYATREGYDRVLQLRQRVGELLLIGDENPEGPSAVAATPQTVLAADPVPG